MKSTTRLNPAAGGRSKPPSAPEKLLGAGASARVRLAAGVVQERLETLRVLRSILNRPWIRAFLAKGSFAVLSIQKQSSLNNCRA